MKTLRWHIEGVLSATGVKDTDVHGMAYRLDRDYKVLDTWLRVKTPAQDLEGIVIDINDDGTSIYRAGQEPKLPDNTTSATCNNFSSLVLLEGSIITLDINQVGQENSGKDLVVELYLEAI